MKTIILIPIALLMTSCVSTQPQSSYNPYATCPPSQTYSQPQPTGYHVEQSGRYGGYSTGYDITPQ